MGLDFAHGEGIYWVEIEIMELGKILLTNSEKVLMLRTDASDTRSGAVLFRKMRKISGDLCYGI